MGLSEPLALLGLLGVALPILAHVVRQKRLPVQPFPSLALLLRVTAARRRRVAMKDGLLLALRVACVVALALALAGPQLRFGAAQGPGVQDLVILLDDSMSMARDEAAPLSRALSLVRSRLDALPEHSSVAVILAGHPARVLFAAQSSPKEVGAALTRAPRSTSRGTDLGSAFDLARRELGRGHHVTARLLVISDFDRQSLAQEVPWASAHVPIEFANVAPHGPVANRRLTRVEVTTHTDREPWSLRVSGRGIISDTAVSLEVDGHDIAHGTLSQGAGERTTQLHFAAPQGQLVPARVHFDSADALPEDDEWPLWLRGHREADVLVVDGAPDPTGRRGESSFFARALIAGAGLGAPSFQVVDDAALGSLRPGSYQAVVLAGALPSRRGARALREFVQAGGGLLIAPGSRLRSRALGRRLGSLLPARLSPSRPAPETARVVLHEPAAGLRQADFEQARLGRYLPLEEPDPSARIWLSLDPGGPLLIEAARGSGRVALLATPLADRVGNLPYQPGYLPLLLKLMERIAGRATRAREAVAGTMVALGSSPDGLEVETPAGAVEDLPADGNFQGAQHVGLYRVREASTGQPSPLSFAVVAPPEEGDLSPGEAPPDLEGETAEADSRRAPTRPVAPWLYLLAGVLVALEGILRASRPSSGLAGGRAR